MMSVLDEIALPLSAALTAAAANTDDPALAGLYEWIGENYSSDDYAKVQAEYRDAIDPKFVAVCARVRRLVPIAKWLGWHERRGLRTLDLGSGAGHMGLIANFFGHSSVGLDCHALYDRLRAFWRQPAVVHNIQASEPLPPIGRFDSITSILTNYGRAWSSEDWDDFLDRILTDHLEPGGELVINFPGDKGIEPRMHIRRRATRMEHGGRYWFFARGVDQ